MNDIKQHTNEDGGADQPDGGTDADADDAGMASQLGQPCISRGTYMLDQTMVQGVGEACDGELVCVRGKCQPLPACAPGVEGECEFEPPSFNGKVDHVTVVDDFVYWTELSTLDELENRRKDGAVARARVGQWKREEVLGGLDLVDDSSHDQRVRSDKWFFFHEAASAEYHDRALSSSGQGPFQVTPKEPFYISDDGFAYWGDVNGLRWQELATGSTGSQTVDGMHAIPIFGLQVDGDHVWYRLIGATELLARMTTAAPHTVTVFSSLHGDFVRALGDTLIAYDAPYVEAAQVVEGKPLQWVHRAKLSNAYTNVVVLSGYLYWVRWDTQRTGALLMRVPLTGSASPQIIAEVEDAVQTDPEINHGGSNTAVLMGSSRGLLFQRRPIGSAWTTEPRLHFLPVD